jgi:hypothetical protein
MGWMIRGSSPRRGWEFFSSPPHPDWLKGPPSLLLPGALSLGVKQLGCETDHSPSSSAKVKNVWSYTYIFMVWYLAKHRSNFTFTFYTFYSLV